ncbi:IucA/IucC family protein [Marinobacter zhanjiangensis]|uniref:Aerobactin siderophore biosynthesis protein IucA n=1 Tax=Marinobacter zhanjiangensis TaxID=578215 RepID=A0ABQ3B1D2_9GAMM|nr:IucA/IucC family protein [Marinobacter zhanjiangensis]GGY73929.1 aerobactin siderophore biosynthesis protein IucA [Marinobacter zhanjiangensis]
MTLSRESVTPSLNAYFNALLRETGPWPWHPRCRHFSITHTGTGERLLIPCRFRSLGGRHLLGPELWLERGSGPEPIGFSEAVRWTLALPELRNQSSPGTRQGFLHRVEQSDDNLRRVLAHRAQHCPAPGPSPQSFIESEQALVNGHSIHPCPKDRGNMSDDEARAFAPEYSARFPLIWYSVDRHQLRCHDSAQASLAGVVESLLEHEPAPLRQAAYAAASAGHTIIPCHPFQHRHWQALPALQELQSKGRLHSLGMGTSRWYATSSLRAIWADDQDWMLKFSLSVRLTNSVRHLQPQEAVRGPGLADLLDTAPARQWLDRHPRFRILNEPVTTVICDNQGQPLPETTLVFRHNPFRNKTDEACELLASLLQDDPATGLSRLGSCLRARNASEADAVAWFRGYLDLAVKPLLDAQGNLGLLFGAHQQNLILRLDRQFRPVAAWFRDCQGTGFSSLAHHRFGPDLAASVRAGENELPDGLGVRLFCYYLFINSTFNVITALAAADLCTEDQLWHQLKQWLQQQRAEGPADTSALDYLQTSPQLYAKNNFLCSLRALNENTLTDLESIYHPMPNPLVIEQTMTHKDSKHHDTPIAH